MSWIAETFCTPTGNMYPMPDGTIMREYLCPPTVAPFLPPAPEELPEIDIPGIGNPGEVDEPNITDDPEEGQTIGPVIPPAETETTTAEPEPGSLAGELDGPSPGQDLPQPHPDVQQEIEEWSDEDDCTEGCNECSAREEGHAGWSRYAPEDAEFVGESAWNGYHYQHDVCKLPYEPATSRIQEWKFASYSWDGFEPGSCTMIEAKYGYDSRLTHRYRTITADDGTQQARYQTIAQPGWEALARSTFRRLVGQARAQIGRLRPYGEPQIGLLWSFSSSDSKAYFFDNGGSNLFLEWRYFLTHIPPSRIY